MTQELRRALVAKLMPAVMKLDLNVDASSDPDLVASQSRVIEQARQLLNDIDSSAKNHVNVKLKKSDIENNHQSNMEIAKLLQKIKIDVMNPNDPNRPLAQSEEELNELLDKKCEENGCVVLDTELGMEDRHLPTNEDKDDFEMKKE